MREKSLFESAQLTPLAELLRPKTIEDVLGQDHLLGEEGALRKLLDQGKVPSLIFWGPPGVGKTTLARLLAEKIDCQFFPLSAVFSGVADLKKVFAQAVELRALGKTTLLFVDEIHRFNRAQQDAFLPYVEQGILILVGATTENPSFELNGALLSRCQVYTLNPLDDGALEGLLLRAVAYKGSPLSLMPEAKDYLFRLADGDGRYFLNLVETLLALDQSEPCSLEHLKTLLQKKAPLYDKNKDAHYNFISALHKSLRGSDVDASLYWFARMLAGGEDPLYLGRRLIRFASEDIGMADPQALPQALAGCQAYERLGSPEGELALAQVVVYLATAPKSNSVYKALKKVTKAAKENNSLPPPLHILNAPTSLMKDMNYGKGYQYDHDTEEGFSGQNYFPDDMARQEFYTPHPRGFEREILKRLEYWKRLRNR